jgi:hypothetical protein
MPTRPYSIDGRTRAYAINLTTSWPRPTTKPDRRLKNGAAIRKYMWRRWYVCRKHQLGAWSGLTPAIILNAQRQPSANVTPRWTPYQSPPSGATSRPLHRAESGC